MKIRTFIEKAIRSLHVMSRGEETTDTCPKNGREQQISQLVREMEDTINLIIPNANFKYPKETENSCGEMIISINNEDVSDSFVVTSCSHIA